MKDSTREALKNEWSGCGGCLLFLTAVFMINVLILIPLSCIIG
jgi:hypothetical protein